MLLWTQQCTTQISLFARLPSAVSPPRKLPLAEKNHFAYGDAPSQGSPSPHPSLGQVCPIFRFSHLVGWDLCWIYTTAQRLPLLRPAPFPFLLQVEIPTALSNTPACSPPSHSRHFRASNLPSVPLDLFPSPLTTQCLHDVSLHFLLNLLLKLLFLKISACRKWSDKLIPSKV